MMNLFVLVSNWYILKYLEALAFYYDEQNQTHHRHSHEKLAKDLAEYLSKYTKKLYQFFYDYTVQAIVGELEESFFECECRANIDMCNFNENYTVNEIIATALIVFENYSWTPGYGGHNWAEITKLLKIKNPILFIDRLVDLQHNTGSALSKHFDIYLDGLARNEQEMLKWILDCKRYENLITQINVLRDFISKDTEKFILRFSNLYYNILINDPNESQNDFSKCIMELSHINDFSLILYHGRKMKEKTIKRLFSYHPVKYTGLGKVITITENPSFYERDKEYYGD